MTRWASTHADLDPRRRLGGGTKEAALMSLMPWFEMGWNVVNVEYRLARVSLAPAAVEDCLCALRWVAANAKQYGFDTSRLVVSGDSAGGHLALTTGMIPESAGLDRQCPGVPLPKVAAIVNWYGITDVGDLLDGPNRKTYAVAWLSGMPDRLESPNAYRPHLVRAGPAAVLTIHGDADPTVPYQHAIRLNEALEKAGVPHQLSLSPAASTADSPPRSASGSSLLSASSSRKIQPDGLLGMPIEYVARPFFTPPRRNSRYLPEGPRLLANVAGPTPNSAGSRSSTARTARPELNILDSDTLENTPTNYRAVPGFIAESRRTWRGLIGSIVAWSSMI